nr:MAG TPA: tail assembly chaperone protein [Caudoviricetes sp.]
MAEATIRINPDNTLTATLSNGAAYTLREPLAKDMAGLSQDLVKIKHTEQVQKLLAKIATPPLSAADYGRLSLSDADVLNTCLNFFSAPPSAKAEMRAALAELGYLPESEYAPATQASS